MRGGWGRDLTSCVNSNTQARRLYPIVNGDGLRNVVRESNDARRSRKEQRTTVQIA